MKRKRTGAVKVEEEEWEVQAVTDSRMMMEYTVRWTDGAVTNEPFENLVPGSEEAVNEFHRLHPEKPSRRYMEHLSEQLSISRTQNGALLNEVQLLKAHRLPDAIQAALFIPHQKLVLEENARLKVQIAQSQYRINEVETRARHWNEYISRLQKERAELWRQVNALKVAQEATEDTWTKQISSLEDAVSRYSAGSADGPTEECRKCGSTESVGLREFPNVRLLLCHACGLQMAKQGKEAVQQHDRARLEENRGLRAENIALCTEVAALKQRLASVEKAVVGWGRPHHDSGYEGNLVDLTAD